jgi:hypothetical protein
LIASYWVVGCRNFTIFINQIQSHGLYKKNDIALLHFLIPKSKKIRQHKITDFPILTLKIPKEGNLFGVSSSETLIFFEYQKPHVHETDGQIKKKRLSKYSWGFS